MEATIRVSNIKSGIIEGTMTVSEHPSRRHYVFVKANPNISFHHGESADSPVTIWCGEKYRTVDQGCHLPFTVGERIIEVDHKAPVEPF